MQTGVTKHRVHTRYKEQTVFALRTLKVFTKLWEMKKDWSTYCEVSSLFMQQHYKTDEGRLVTTGNSHRHWPQTTTDHTSQHWTQTQRARQPSSQRYPATIRLLNPSERKAFHVCLREEINSFLFTQTRLFVVLFVWSYGKCTTLLVLLTAMEVQWLPALDGLMMTPKINKCASQIL